MATTRPTQYQNPNLSYQKEFNTLDVLPDVYADSVTGFDTQLLVVGIIDQNAYETGFIRPQNIQFSSGSLVNGAYVPEPGFTGEVTVTYEIKSDRGNRTITNEVTFNVVEAVEGAPVELGTGRETVTLPSGAQRNIGVGVEGGVPTVGLGGLSAFEDGTGYVVQFNESTEGTAVVIDADGTPVIYETNGTGAYDPDGGSVSIQSIEATNGTVELVDGQYIYTPNQGFYGYDAIVYTLVDDQGQTFTNASSVEVIQKYDDVQLVDDSLTITAFNKDGSVFIDPDILTRAFVQTIPETGEEVPVLLEGVNYFSSGNVFLNIVDQNGNVIASEDQFSEGPRNRDNYLQEWTGQILSNIGDDVTELTITYSAQAGSNANVGPQFYVEPEYATATIKLIDYSDSYPTTNTQEAAAYVNSNGAGFYREVEGRLVYVPDSEVNSSEDFINLYYCEPGSSTGYSVEYGQPSIGFPDETGSPTFPGVIDEGNYPPTVIEYIDCTCVESILPTAGVEGDDFIFSKYQTNNDNNYMGKRGFSEAGDYWIKSKNGYDELIGNGQEVAFIAGVKGTVGGSEMATADILTGLAEGTIVATKSFASYDGIYNIANFEAGSLDDLLATGEQINITRIDATTGEQLGGSTVLDPARTYDLGANEFTNSLSAQNGNDFGSIIAADPTLGLI